MAQRRQMNPKKIIEVGLRLAVHGDRALDHIRSVIVGKRLRRRDRHEQNVIALKKFHHRRTVAGTRFVRPQPIAMARRRQAMELRVEACIIARKFLGAGDMFFELFIRHASE